MSRPATARRSVLGAALAVTGLLTAACGSDSLSGGETSSSSTTTTATATTSADAALTAMLPESVRSAGVLRVGTNAEYPPNEYVDGSTIKGMDIDVMNAVGAKLGVKVEYANAGFDTLIAGVQANRYDVAISSFTINADRLQQVNMVQYYNAGSQWATTKGNPKDVDPADACGLTVAVQTGSTQAEEDLPARSKACTDAGKAAIDIASFDSQETATSAVVQGRAAAAVADSPITAYAVKQTGDKLQLLGDVYDAAPYGIVVPKDQTAEAQAISQALAALSSEGTYTAALSTWGGQNGAVTTFDVNPAVS